MPPHPSSGRAAALAEAAMPAAAAALAKAMPFRSGPYTLLDLRNTPIPLKFTWSRDALYPAALCLRKDIKVLQLVRFTAKADLTLPDLRLVCGFSCKDTLFHGRFSVNVAGRMVEYRKKFQLPNGTGLAVSAGLQHTAGWNDLTTRPFRDQIHPTLAAQLTLGSGSSGNVVMSGDGFDCKQRVPIPRRFTRLQYPRFELETFATIKVPQLTTRYSVQRDAHRYGVRSGFGLGDEQQPLHLHVAAANLVVRL
ncbi:hypothetical protein D9Q98_009470 [Chlorella vulgaris]|uniref:Uncharacterized protein n=1 Tax=Chlorella vulgaris TaxID=3077 RepID=A0A9D4TFA3_CHLVU|nr:hypothetical protein D9Q98_009470 [Chlorella vulgaris]